MLDTGHHPDCVLRVASPVESWWPIAIKGTLERPPSLTSTDAAMVMDIKDTKILDSIISLIPIDVVNVFSEEQLSPEVLFHNPTMFTDSLPVNGDRPITRWVIDVLPLGITGHRAKATCGRAGREIFKQRATLTASELSHGLPMASANTFASQSSDGSYSDTTTMGRTVKRRFQATLSDVESAATDRARVIFSLSPWAEFRR